MKRYTFAMKIKKGCKGLFRRNLGLVWNDLTDFLDFHNAMNFSIWNVEDLVFGYYESENEIIFSETDRQVVSLWESSYGDSYEWLSTPFENMRLMYHDIGYVRTNKELIRHRVFITKLVPGMEEEYKTRHDALIEARGDKITEGPDSNFTIWYAGGYIFGYNEIDTTMEHEMTVEERENTIQWEKRMLEIMEWKTNDVDWITGECHETIKRIAWHA